MRRSSAAPPPVPQVVVVLKGYPRVSETFVAHELAALERRGLALHVVSLRRPYDVVRHPVHATIRAPVTYLPEYLYEAPGRVLRGHARAFARAPRRYLRALGLWLADLRRDLTPNRGRRFGQAGVLAAELPAGAVHLHAHFLHTPASVSRYAAAMTGLAYSLSGHAKDVWTTPDWELRAKLREARFTVTCTAAGRARLDALAPGRVELVYHGLDRRLFAAPPAFGSRRDGTDPADPVRLLAVGRFQPKKGYATLLDAVARVRAAVSLTVVGYGPLESALRAHAEAVGLGERIVWAGPLDQPAVLERYRASDLFLIASEIAPDGDRDGLPNVVVEALSQGLPVVATCAAAIPELVVDGIQGRLVPLRNAVALAAAIEALARDPDTRRRMGEAGIARVAEGWDLDAGADRLSQLLDAARPGPGRAAARVEVAPSVPS
jgi:glycosyltransferase involved in cell wall biosynthesis